jgi:hypothetical protein
MTIIELGAVGEFAGSLLMLGTLIYPAFQVRQAKELVQTSVALGRGDASREINGYLLTSPELIRLQIEKASHDDILESTEIARSMHEPGCGGEDAQGTVSWLYIAARAIECPVSLPLVQSET